MWSCLIHRHWPHIQEGVSEAMMLGSAGGLGDSGSIPLNSSPGAPGQHSGGVGGSGSGAMGPPFHGSFPGASASVGSGGGGLKPSVWLGSYDSLRLPAHDDSPLHGYVSPTLYHCDPKHRATDTCLLNLDGAAVVGGIYCLVHCLMCSAMLVCDIYH